MTLVSASRINDIADEWRRAIDSDSLLVTPEWLRVSESSGDSSKYLVLPDTDAALVAGRIEAGAFPTNDPVALLADSGETGAPLKNVSALYPVAASALPGAYLPGVLSGKHSALNNLLNGLEEHAASWNVRTTAIMHVPDDSKPLLDVLKARGYVGAAVLAQCVLDVEWSNFEEYLRSLSRNRRTSVRRERRVFAEAGMTVEEVDVRATGRELAELHARQLQRYGHDIPEERLVELLERIAQHLVPWCRVITARRDGHLEAFALCYETNGELHPKMTGFSEYAERHFAYFNVTYYILLECAIRHGINRIVLGPLSYEAKVARGCRLEPRSTFLNVPSEFAETVSALAKRVDQQRRGFYQRLSEKRATT